MEEKEYKWRGTKHRWTLREMQSIDLASFEFLKMSVQERAELAQSMYNAYQTRRRQFIRAKTTGFALMKLEEDFETPALKRRGITNATAPILINKRTRELNPAFLMTGNPHNALAAYINVMQDFLTAKSSTVKGWRQIAKEQDARLFGEKYTIRIGKRKGETAWRLKRGQYRMTDNERTMFWKVYRELYKAGWSGVNDYSSDSQREVASYFTTGEFRYLDMDEIVIKLKERMNIHPEFAEEHISGRINDPFQQAHDVEDEGSKDVWGREF